MTSEFYVVPLFHFSSAQRFEKMGLSSLAFVLLVCAPYLVAGERRYCQENITGEKFHLHSAHSQ